MQFAPLQNVLVGKRKITFIYAFMKIIPFSLSSG